MIYKSLSRYRFFMNLLYQGKYQQRFEKIIPHIQGSSVTELCFGDTFIAEYCAKQQIQWKGIDLNPTFVRAATNKGFDAVQADINDLDAFPKADTFIMAGSLYHFDETLEALFQKIFNSANYFILSEPIQNISSNKGILGGLGAYFSSVNGKTHRFRYDENSLKARLQSICSKLNLTFEVIDQDRDLLVIIKK